MIEGFRRGLLPGAAAVTMASVALVPAGGASAAAVRAAGSATHETRTTQQVAPGVTLTTIRRGSLSPDDFYTVNIGLPTGDVPPDPDPDAPTAALAPRDKADSVAAQLKAAGYTARVEPVSMPEFADTPPGPLGYRVRVGRYATLDEANAASAEIKAASFVPSVVYTGQDGTPTTGPWVVRALTVDFHAFHGTVAETHDTSLAGRRTTTQIATDSGALAAVNGGYFIIAATDGVVGDSAGVIVEHGRLLHDTTNGRVAAILRDGGRRLELKKLWSTITLRDDRGRDHAVEGLNRAPGLIRDCGGHAGDLPTSKPRMDTTCTNPNEMVAFTPEFGAPVPAGAGSEAVLDAHGRVVSEGARTARTVPAGGTVVEAIGTEAAWLDAHATTGRRLRVRTQVTGDGGRPVRFGPRDSVVNGGPQLVTGGRVSIAPDADGLIHPGDPSWFYGWGIRRNPRTMIGSDRQGRLLLVEVDGRKADNSQGLSIPEGGALMRSLGAVQAMNLDGGGSSTMVVGGKAINTPSDDTGERPVGDAVVVLPGH